MGTNITGIGNANAIGFKSRVTGGAYFPPELKDALVGVWSAYGKSNDSTDRNIIKNKIKDKGGDFVISNAAFKRNSGFGFYTNFRDAGRAEIEVLGEQHWLIKKVTNVIPEPILIEANKFNRYGYLLRIKCSGIVNTTDVYTNVGGSKTFLQNGINIIDAKNEEVYSSGFIVFGIVNDATNIEIQILPEFEGAFVTDGVDDLITSTKTVQEMLGGSNELTIVSMIHQVKDSANNVSFTNYIRGSANGYFRNIVNNYGKTGIYGYTSSDLMGLSVVNNILGDKNDYTSNGDNRDSIINGNFSVQGYSYNDGNNTGDFSSVAWRWTIIANKVLTTDQINQVIAYFNLDRTLKPDILCNTIKQGITNENHAEFGDRLIDFSGNGRDIQLNNIAWKGDSGIGKYEVDFLDSSIWTSSNSTITSSKIDCKNAISHIMLLYYHVGSKEYPDIPSFKVIKTGADIDYSYIDETGFPKSVKIVDGVNILPASHNTLYSGSSRFCGFGNPGMGNSVTITQIPSHAGGLCLDGVNDFGKVTGMPIYKDYTFIIDRQIISIGDTAGVVASKSEDSADATKHGAFIFEYLGAPDKISTWSFYKDNGQVANTDFTRGISYQSTYSYNGKDLTIGTSKDSDKLWLGTIRDNDTRFFNGAIYSLMSFPYSMSKFLIERQLKKYKLGTLYPNMVEFRPVINSNVLLDSKPTFVIRGTNTYLNAGDYVPENSQIWISIKMNNIADRITKFTVNGKTIDIPENAYSEVTLQYGFPFVIDKSPQKIGITIEQDENYVLFNPVINSNYDNYKLTFHLREYEKLINIGDYIPKGTYIRANLYLKNNIDELVTFTFNGVNIDYAKSPVLDTAYNIRQIYNYDSPQEVNITIDEYIRYEDIDFTNCYPGVPRIYVNDKSVTWGDKLKVGDEFTFYGNVNILPKMYNVLVKALYNGEEMVYGSIGTISKSMVFTSFKTYLLDNNEPKCILSPSRLRIPNSSYKLLGYIPDISGHGNHGKINNSAYAGMSGANGYPYDYKSTSDFVAHAINAVLVNSETVKFINVLTQISFYYKGTSYKGKIKVTGITKAIASGKVRYLDIYSNSPTNNDRVIIDKDGIYDVNIETEDAINIFFYLTPIVSGTTALDEPVYLEQVGNYEGSICFDGVDDYMDIPSLSIGGKQVLMKTNWLKSPTLLYDQRAFAILTTKEDDATNPRIAYQARNQDGKTYIDGIENNYIETYSLKGVTHNITVTNPSAGSGVVPVIGANTGKSSGFAKMALYDFMLFDEVSTNEEIKQLNDIVGIEGGYVQKPPYYWDAYGKTNLDADKATIQQRGVAVGDYDLINNNFAYEGMSGYNGYPAVFGANKTYANLVPNDGNFILTSSHNIINVTKFDTSYGLLYSHIKLDGKLTSRNIDYPSYKIKVTGLGENFGLHYSYLKNPSDANLSAFGIGTDGTYTIPKSFASDGSLINNNVWIGFIFTGTAPESCNVTIEVLPEYENGLVYDGVDDYSENTSIPAFTDYTYIIKYEDFNNPNTGSCIQRKGSIKAGGGAFVQDHIYRGTKYQYNFGISSNIHKDDSIAFCTKTNYNGTAIPSGNNTDDTGFTIGKFDGYRKMVFYKEMLYPRTVNMLTINMIKNMMAEDGIIDIQGKLFTDKFTGDFNLDFNKDFLIGN